MKVKTVNILDKKYIMCLSENTEYELFGKQQVGSWKIINDKGEVGVYPLDLFIDFTGVNFDEGTLGRAFPDSELMGFYTAEDLERIDKNKKIVMEVVDIE